MSTIPVQRLNEHARNGVVAHFLSLSAEDRRLRFGTPLSAEAITAYVERIDFERDAAFAVHDDSLLIVGIAHVALSDHHAELGLSVLPAHRGRGIGSALFARGAQHARNRFVRALFMHCLRENAAVVHIAQRFGMQIVTESGDADAHLELLPASAVSIAGELVDDRLARYDYALKVEVAAWKGVNSALAEAARHTR
jgi:GNAT superfamily N-acetyltransferase